MKGKKSPLASHCFATYRVFSVRDLIYVKFEVLIFPGFTYKTPTFTIVGGSIYTTASKLVIWAVVLRGHSD
jgi:hypothetical protein